MKNKCFNIAALILSIYLLGLSLISAWDFLGRTEYLKSGSYFKSSLFKNELTVFFYNVKSFHIDYRDYAKKSDYDKIGLVEVNKIKEDYNLQLKERENEINNTYISYVNNGEKVQDANTIKFLAEERDKKLKEVRDEFSAKVDKEIKKRVVQKDEDYTSLKNSLSQRDDIKYYIKDVSTNEVYSNIENITDIKTYIKYKALYSIEFPREMNSHDLLFSINDDFKSLNLGGYFIVPREIAGYNQMQANYNYYNSIKERVVIEGALFVISLGIAILILLYLKKNDELLAKPMERFTGFLRRIPLDIRAAILIIFVIITLTYLSSTPFFYLPFNIEHIFTLTMVSLLTLYIVLNLLDWINLLKNKDELQKQWKNGLLCKVKAIGKESFTNKSIMFKVITIFILTGLFCMFIVLALIAMSNNSDEILLLSILYIFIYVITVPYYVLKKISLLNKIISGSEKIVSGNLNYTIKAANRGQLSKLANNINNMKEGYKNSLEEQIKSERLKSELITNVSHDLKTPLTSMVNYVDLLKKEDLSKEEIQGYVGILDRKTQRLKTLIEDLFEASKVASGSVELNIERIDVAALLKQALGEFDEKIISSSLVFKVNIPSHKVYSDLDGKKTWRVFENLINNALKYSQPNTRVYIDLLEMQDKVIITVKNISSYEMNFNVEEIFERFKRGDESRNTEGSGLGLAIAKSIVELQGGKLDIEIDGDLFKAIVQF